ncbi:PhlD [Streptomyces sp. P17]|uniref:PhlD n=1 Tax=Streptomyces sp. P17 TaxID=3074716 RepID=UPI0028F3FC3B|nr:PhlD [Streptomyces sp. P17]MDT9698164.1 PhlD [Streptomyces sp. P17]
MPVVTAPVVALPRYQVTTDELIERIVELYPNHPRMNVVQRVIRRSTVRTRWYTRPLEEQFNIDAPLYERTREHLRDSLAIAERAGRAALREAGLRPEDVTALVVSSATGHSMPGLDVLLMERLGLPPSVRRIPVTQMGCVGGVFAVSTAAELVKARPDAIVLVVCADAFSHYLHPGDAGMDGMIFKAILGDAGGACVVRERVNGPHMEIVGSWEFLDVSGKDIVGGRTEDDGLHAHNSPRLAEVVGGLLPGLREWLKATAPAGTDGAPEFLVSHTGSPRILDCLSDGLDCPSEMFGLARDSLRELGNLGSVSVLEVMERTFAKRPEPGARGLMLGVGPGVCLMAVKTIWRNGV